MHTGEIVFMPMPQNLLVNEWSSVLLDGVSPQNVATHLRNHQWLPWADILLNWTEDAESVLDLGSGRGENCAVLGLHGKKTTLLDWSMENLHFGSSLFKEMQIEGKFCRADMMAPLPFESNSFDVVFSCGVFEYFTKEESLKILREAFRVTRKRVIIMVPNAWSIAYRVGKWYMEKKGTWDWGGEVPAYTLRGHLKNVGFDRVGEFTFAAGHSLKFLTMPLPQLVRSTCGRISKLLDQPAGARLKQGYLLVSIGDKSEHSRKCLP